MERRPPKEPGRLTSSGCLCNGNAEGVGKYVVRFSPVRIRLICGMVQDRGRQEGKCSAGGVLPSPGQCLQPLQSRHPCRPGAIETSSSVTLRLNQKPKIDQLPGAGFIIFVIPTVIEACLVSPLRQQCSGAPLLDGCFGKLINQERDCQERFRVGVVYI